jgi:hypothetical protein
MYIHLLSLFIYLRRHQTNSQKKFLPGNKAIKMKKLFALAMISLALFAISAIQRNDGIAGRTGSPGETTCNTTGCHVGNAINAVNGSISISAPTLLNWEYVPGEVYPISVTVARQGVSLYGIGFEALRTTGANGGTLSITNGVQTTLMNAFVSGNNRTNVVHNLNGGASANNHTFTFNWTAPLTNVGNITFYAAGNAANGNNTTSGDFIYTTSQVITPSTVGVSELNVFAGSVKVFPNPVAEQMNIRYTLIKKSSVTVNLISANGKNVLTMISEMNEPGEHTLEIPADPSFGKGIYFLELLSGESRLIKKVVII